MVVLSNKNFLYKCEAEQTGVTSLNQHLIQRAMVSVLRAPFAQHNAEVGVTEVFLNE